MYGTSNIIGGKCTALYYLLFILDFGAESILFRQFIVAPEKSVLLYDSITDGTYITFYELKL